MNYKEFSDEVNNLNFEDYSTLLSIVNQYRRSKNSLGVLCPTCGHSYFKFHNITTGEDTYWVGTLKKYPNLEYMTCDIICLACNHKLHSGHGSSYYQCPDCYPEFSLAIKELMDLKDLPEGWDFGDGLPIKMNVIIAAIQVSCLAFDADFWIESNAISNGGINLIIGFGGVDGNETLDIIVKPDLTFSLTKERGSSGFKLETLEEVNEISFDEVKQAIENL